MAGNYTSKEDEAYFAAIGRLVIAWAHLEFSLDAIVEIMHWGFGGKDFEAEIPRALNRKIAYLRAAIKRIPLPEESARGFQILFDQIEASSQTRHDVVHGIVVEHAEESGEATMVRTIRKKENVEKRQYKMTTADILKAANEAARIGGMTLRLVGEIYDLVRKLAKEQAIEKRP